MEKEKIDKLMSYLCLAQDELKLVLKNELDTMNRATIWDDGFLYSPGTHPVLLVAHLDTVHEALPTEIRVDTTANTNGDLSCEEGIGGDDRCGVYIVMEIVKYLNCHIIFCEDEEKHGTGAEKFTHSGIRPDVQFIVEFDKSGRDDCVFYGCENRDFVNFVEQYGFIETRGTFSDISWIAPALNIAAVNLSSGYYNAHTKEEYIRLDDVESVIERAIPLIADVSKKYEYA